MVLVLLLRNSCVKVVRSGILMVSVILEKLNAKLRNVVYQKVLILVPIVQILVVAKLLMNFIIKMASSMESTGKLFAISNLMAMKGFSQ